MLIFVLGAAIISASGESWLEGWSHRKPITLTEQSGATLTDYQVKLEISYESGMESDFSDLRFTDEDGITGLSYWIEEYTGSSSATVWVKAAEISAGSDKTIYMYYGNPSVGSTSEGDTTFEFFDVSGIKAFWHMDEPSWSGASMEVKDETGNFDGTTKNGANTIAGGKFKRAGSFDGTNDYIDTGINTNNEYAINDDMTWSVWVKTMYTGDQYPIAVWDAIKGIAYLQLNNGVISARTSNKRNGYCLIGQTTYPDIDDGNWHHIIAGIDVTNGDVKIDIDGESQTVTLIRNQDVSGASYSKPWMIGKYSNLYFHGSIDELMFYNRILSASETSGIYNNYMEKMGSYYNIRKYADSEPTYSIGGEETVTTTTTLPTCSLGAECSSCVGWVTMDVNHYMCTGPYDTCVRDNNYNSKYDQICCTGTVQGITPL